MQIHPNYGHFHDDAMIQKKWYIRDIVIMSKLSSFRYPLLLLFWGKMKQHNIILRIFAHTKAHTNSIYFILFLMRT